MKSPALLAIACLSLGCARLLTTPAATTYHLDAKLAEPGTTYRWAFDPAPHFAPSPPSPIESTTPHDRFFAVLGRWQVAIDASAPSAPHVLRQERRYGTHETPRVLVEHLAFESLRVKTTCKIEGEGSCGVVFRAVDGDDYLAVRLDPRSSEIVLVRAHGSTETTIERSSVPKTETSPSAEGWHALDVTVRGNDTFVTVDGTLAFSAVVPEHEGGRRGLIGLTHRGEGGASFDDFEATAYKP